MKRYIVTGAPGAGKTAVVRELAMRGYDVVEEAATDVIARAHAECVQEPWRDPGFADRIVAVQRRRQEKPVAPGTAVQFHDRSAICTLALARYLGHPVSDVLAAEVDQYVRSWSQ